MSHRTRSDNTSESPTVKRISRAHIPVIATVCTSILVAAGVLTPSHSDTALAADSTAGDTFGFLDTPDQGTTRQDTRELARMNLGQLEKAPAAAPQAGVVYPLPELPRVTVSSGDGSSLALTRTPEFNGRLGYKYAAVTERKNIVFYTIDAELQEVAERLVKNAQANHVAIVAMNPRTGAVLAVAGKSHSVPNVEYHSGFPAASLFKVVTAAAAVEEAGLDTDSMIPFRGGTYTLNQWNFMPDSRKDRRRMTIGEAMGRSCNPVFGHIGVQYLNAPILAKFARRFGFNQSLDFEAPLENSSAVIPKDSAYELSRTAAGFGQVTINPIHAAAMAAGVANGGLLPKPHIVEKISSQDGVVLQQTEPQTLQRIVNTSTSQTLLEMMHHTTTIGTSRREFMRGSRPTLGNIQVAAKTGTLTGTNPRGLNNWFIASAPISNPQLALAVITVDARSSSKASTLGRRMFEKYFNVAPSEPEPRIVRSPRTPKKQFRGKYVKPSKKSSYGSSKKSAKSKKKS